MRDGDSSRTLPWCARAHARVTAAPPAVRGGEPTSRHPWQSMPRRRPWRSSESGCWRHHSRRSRGRGDWRAHRSPCARQTRLRQGRARLRPERRERPTAALCGESPATAEAATATVRREGGRGPAAGWQRGARRSWAPERHRVALPSPRSRTRRPWEAARRLPRAARRGRAPPGRSARAPREGPASPEEAG
jgi:hypothetical protein